MWPNWRRRTRILLHRLDRRKINVVFESVHCYCVYICFVYIYTFVYLGLALYFIFVVYLCWWRRNIFICCCCYRSQKIANPQLLHTYTRNSPVFLGCNKNTLGATQIAKRITTITHTFVYIMCIGNCCITTSALKNATKTIPTLLVALSLCTTNGFWAGSRFLASQFVPNRKPGSWSRILLMCGIRTLYTPTHTHARAHNHRQFHVFSLDCANPRPRDSSLALNFCTHSRQNPHTHTYANQRPTHTIQQCAMRWIQNKYNTIVTFCSDFLHFYAPILRLYVFGHWTRRIEQLRGYTNKRSLLLCTAQWMGIGNRNTTTTTKDYGYIILRNSSETTTRVRH